MRYIGLRDSAGTPIFEADTLEITDRSEMNFDEPFLDFLKVDRITFEILPRNGEVGVAMRCHFWANGEKILNSAEAEYHKFCGVGDEEIKLHFEGHIMSEPMLYLVESWNDTMTFHHGFIHKKSKTIINRTVPTEGREKLVEEADYRELTITIDGDKYPASKTEFLVKLTPEAHEKALKYHNSLYCDETFVGSFTHALLKVKNISLYECSFRAEPVNELGEHTWFILQPNQEKVDALVDVEREKLVSKIEKWTEENQHLSEEEIKSNRIKIHREGIKLIRAIKEDPVNEIEVPNRNLFLGLNMSSNLFDFFNDTKCEITAKVI